MSRRTQCPLPALEQCWIDLPDLPWLGRHAQRRDEAAEKAKDLGQTLQSFAVALALLEDWSLPGLTGNPERWDYGELNLSVIAWVTQEVLSDFYKCFEIPKN